MNVFDKKAVICPNAKIFINAKGEKIVELNKIVFSGKRNVNWDDVRDYLSRYVGKQFLVFESNEIIYVSSDFPKEVKGSEDTVRLNGGNAKAKANMMLAVPLIIYIATNKRHQDNYKSKHNNDAKYGWNRYTSKCNIPVFLDNGLIERYNTYRIELLVRKASDGKMYLYDLVNIKKETSTPYRN